MIHPNATPLPFILSIGKCTRKNKNVYGIKCPGHLITKPIMKKTIFSLTAVLMASGMLMAQQNKKTVPTPPPPPPLVEKAEMAVPPPPPPPMIKKVEHNEENSFARRNPQVEGLSWTGDGSTVVVHLKNGSEERYNLENKEEAEKARLRYGKFPAPPPPPPPVPAPPATPEKPVIRS